MGGFRLEQDADCIDVARDAILAASSTRGEAA